MPKEITDTFNKVKHLLETDKKYRDNDRILIVRFWNDELKMLRMECKKITALDFFMVFMDEDKITSSDYITRARRKVNQLHADTIGKSYKPRMEKEGKMKDDLAKIGKKKK